MGTMAMTIDKAIDHGKDQLQIFGGEHKEFIELSIDIMHKYQKIQEIVKNTQQLCSYGNAFIDIREVVEDGNDD